MDDLLKETGNNGSSMFSSFWSKGDSLRYKVIEKKSFEKELHETRYEELWTVLDVTDDEHGHTVHWLRTDSREPHQINWFGARLTGLLEEEIWKPPDDTKVFRREKYLVIRESQQLLYKSGESEEPLDVKPGRYLIQRDLIRWPDNGIGFNRTRELFDLQGAIIKTMKNNLSDAAYYGTERAAYEIVLSMQRQGRDGKTVFAEEFDVDVAEGKLTGRISVKKLVDSNVSFPLAQIVLDAAMFETQREQTLTSEKRTKTVVANETYLTGFPQFPILAGVVSELAITRRTAVGEVHTELDTEKTIIEARIAGISARAGEESVKPGFEDISKDLGVPARLFDKISFDLPIKTGASIGLVDKAEQAPSSQNISDAEGGKRGPDFPEETPTTLPDEASSSTDESMEPGETLQPAVTEKDVSSQGQPSTFIRPHEKLDIRPLRITLENNIPVINDTVVTVFNIGKGASNRTKSMLSAIGQKYPGSYLKCINTGMELFSEKKYGKASFYFHKALFIIKNFLKSKKLWPPKNLTADEINQFKHEIERLAKSYDYLARCFVELGEKKHAAGFYFKSAELYRLIPSENYGKALLAYGNFARLLLDQWDDDTAIRPLEEYTKLMEQNVPSTFIPAQFRSVVNVPPVPFYPGYARLLLGTFFKKIKQSKSMVENFQKASKWFSHYIREFARDPSDQLLAIRWLVVIETVLGDRHKAAQCSTDLEKAWDNIKKEGDPNLLQKIGSEMPLTIEIILAYANKQYDKARKMLIEKGGVLKPLDYEVLHTCIC